MTPRDSQKQALEAAVKELDRRIAANRTEITNAQTDQAQEVSRALNRVGHAEAELQQLENNPGPTKALGFLLGLAAGFCCFLFLAFVVFGGQTDHVGIVLGVSFVVGLGTNLLFAGSVVQKHQSKISESQRQYEQSKSDAECRLNERKAVLDDEAGRLKRQRDECQAALKKLLSES